MGFWVKMDLHGGFFLLFLGKWCLSLEKGIFWGNEGGMDFMKGILALVSISH